MQMPGYPAGLPNPLVRHWHPYPTRFHGSIYTRPVFELPYVLSPSNVAQPGEIAGLGSYDVGCGVFRPGGYGGGVFDGNLSGLGATSDQLTYLQGKLKEAEQAIAAIKAASFPTATANDTAMLAALQQQMALIQAEIKKLQVPGIPMPSAPSPVVPSAAPAEAIMMGQGSSNKWMAFAVGGGLALGVLVYLKKKKKI